MDDVDLLEQAHTALLRSFSSSLRAPYYEGKAQMADQVCESLGVPHENAVALIDALEKSRRITFVGPSGGTRESASMLEADVLTPRAATGRTDASAVPPETAPAQPVLGEWIIV
ncbi:MAG: hypothetical protein JXO22_09680 [Phycisphaerae bacterium]|nr:hypothetical protein [Phycisphaerae bacterium]